MGAQWKHAGREANSKAKAKLISKAAKELLIAAKGGDDPDTNVKLRLVNDTDPDTADATLGTDLAASPPAGHSTLPAARGMRYPDRGAGGTSGDGTSAETEQHAVEPPAGPAALFRRRLVRRPLWPRTMARPPAAVGPLPGVGPPPGPCTVAGKA